MRRFDFPGEIQRPDPRRDCQRSQRTSFSDAFCLDSTRTYGLALHRAHCAPGISRLPDDAMLDAFGSPRLPPPRALSFFTDRPNRSHPGSDEPGAPGPSQRGCNR